MRTNFTRRVYSYPNKWRRMYTLLFGMMCLSSISLAQSRDLSGKVTSSDDNLALPGVNVVIKGTSTGTVTDVEGNYNLKIPEEPVLMVFSSVGYTTEEVTVTNESVLNMVLMRDI